MQHKFQSRHVKCFFAASPGAHNAAFNGINVTFLRRMLQRNLSNRSHNKSSANAPAAYEINNIKYAH